jgi:site-specific DNA-methyltransferase (adenine-specific)
MKDFANLPAKDKIYYQDESVVIYCADNREILPLFPDKSFDLVLTSPPYDNLRDYKGLDWDFETTANNLPRVLTTGGIAVWIVGDAVIDGSETGTSFKQALYFKDLGLKLHDTMIYVKDAIPAPQNTRYNQMFEFMFIFSNGKPNSFNPIKVKSKGYKPSASSSKRFPDGHTELLKGKQGAEYRTDGNVWFYPVGYMKSAKSDYIFEHPAIFPEALAFDHISSWSNPSDLVLDPFLGSGTTAVAAKILGRKCVGIEISEKYCEIAARRCSQSVMQLDIPKEAVEQGEML